MSRNRIIREYIEQMANATMEMDDDAFKETAYAAAQQGILTQVFDEIDNLHRMTIEYQGARRS
jgi:hypothetical protein